MLDSLARIGGADPLRGPGRVLGRLVGRSCSLVVISEEPSELVLPIAVEALHCPGDRRVVGSALSLQLRRVSDFLHERVAKRELPAVQKWPLLNQLRTAQPPQG